MPLVETLPVTPDTAQWPVWGTAARVVVTDPRVLPAARALVEVGLDAVERACSRFHPSELRDKVNRADGHTVTVSPLLAGLISAAIEAAVVSDGDVVPTLGKPLAQLGYDRDFIRIDNHSSQMVVAAPQASWTDIRLRGRDLTLPKGMELDLGATAKAHAADWCARLVSDRLRVGALVSLGGDIATGGPAEPDGGWRVLIRDLPGDPPSIVALRAGCAIATSSTASRQWRRGGVTLHHILDPKTCLPAQPVWRTASIAAETCLRANTLSTASLVRGQSARPWLSDLGVPARLVSADGDVTVLNGWPS